MSWKIEMYLLWIIMIFTYNTEMKCDNYFERLVNDVGADILQSFYRLKDKVFNFFDISLSEIVRRGAIIGKALRNFFIEATKKDVVGRLSKAVGVVQNRAATTTNAVKAGGLRMKTDECLDFQNLVTADGYASASYTVLTDDGYLLKIHRLLASSKNASVGKKGVVLLHHGLFGSSDDWLLLGSNKSLPYLLLNADYDVWLTNARGNKYSKSHKSIQITNMEFWNFSWHEIGRFDLAAVIDYIRDVNGKVKLYYVGYSMGATALLVLLSMMPKYNDFMNIAILIAPLVFMQNVKGPLQPLAQHYKPDILYHLGVRENSPLQLLPTKIASIICKKLTVHCKNPLILLAQKFNEKIKTKIDRFTPGGGSMKTIIHYMQLIQSGKFKMYEHGSPKRDNEPALAYNLNNVVLPLVVFTSLGDWISTISDVEYLLLNLPEIALYHKVASYDFNHLDFMWSDNADILVYHNILEILRQFRLLNTTAHV